MAFYCLPIIVNSFQTAPTFKNKRKSVGSELYPQGRLTYLVVHARVRGNLQGLILNMKILEKERLQYMAV
ncbi:unnamed protein product [Lactuca virosa]|uniref:Uncharacterized protein n=1 Tax=Lactuca virosa TaxID=75947 RepID=A0AAU9NT05_9ASTR|nr:unnamed protein product [Lactuca virosa]